MTAPPPAPGSTDHLRTRVFRCSFCTKPSTDVAKLIAGPGVYICDACVGRCNGILDAAGTTEPARFEPPWGAMSDDEILAGLPAIAASVDQVETTLRAWIVELRTRRVAWARIGAALGMTRQSAWERFAAES